MKKDTLGKPKILFYDIETNLSQFLGFRLGKQVVRHNQLMPEDQYTPIICITYCSNNGKPAKALIVDNHNIKKVIAKFDKICSKCDVVIGKNSDRFDNKHINTQRLLNNLPGRPDWIKYTDDLEKQFRKHFNLLSQSLDYISTLLKLGGKDKMGFDDWVSIYCYRKMQMIEELTDRESAQALSKLEFSKSYTEVMTEGRKALNKMVTYGKKDVEDTRAIWEYAEKHFEPRYNAATRFSPELRCKHCGSRNIHKNGRRVLGKSEYQTFFCRDHGGYAGKVLIKDENWLGKIG